jgi:hypothetical protein
MENIIFWIGGAAETDRKHGNPFTSLSLEIDFLYLPYYSLFSEGRLNKLNKNLNLNQSI